jgi:hypothetical protein
MAASKVRRVRVSARISVSVRDRLTKYCAASGISERAVVETALRQYLEGSSDSALILRRLDRLQVLVGRDHRDLELLSEAFGLYMRAWFLAHSPSVAENSKTMRAGEGACKIFAQHLGERFSAGHRFVDDLPRGSMHDEDPSEIT